MKKLFILILTITVVLSCFSVQAEAKEANAKSNWGIVKELCRKSGYANILLIDSNKTTDKTFWKIIDHRKGKPYIVVEKVVSVSDGSGHGWYSTKTKGTNYIIGYNKRVAKGKKVTSYVIWNPKSNGCDDILYVVDNKTWR